MTQRDIVEIDQEKCNGCGQCASACAEGAIEIRAGKARLVSDVYCDGLGACLGECPQGAIRIVEREAAPFSEEAVHARSTASAAIRPAPPAHAGCPGAAVRSLPQLHALPRQHAAATPTADGEPPPEPSALANWPVQLRLVPPNAPFLQGADLLLVADCVPFAQADFHRRLLRGRPVVIGCPKLDDGQFYVEKLAAILATAAVRSLTVVHMEVPCCTSLVRIAEAAVQRSGLSVPLGDVTIAIPGRT